MKTIKKTILIFFFIFILFTSCATNNPVFSHLVLEWLTSFGGQSKDSASYVIPISDGGFAGIGTSESSFPGNPNHGKADILLVKFNSKGEKIWEKLFGGSENDYGQSIIQTQDNGFLICGVTESPDALADEFHPPFFGGKDIWIIKTNSSGIVQWTNTYGGTGDDIGKNIFHSFDSNTFIICGKSDSINGDFGYLQNHGKFDGIIFDIQADGGEVIQKIRIGGSQDDEIVKVVEGKYRVFFGNTNSSEILFWHPGYDLLGKPNPDIWLGIYNDNSGIISQNCLGGSESDLFSDAVTDPNDNSGFLVLSSTKSHDGDLSSSQKDKNSDPHSSWWIFNISILGPSDNSNFIINWQLEKDFGLLNEDCLTRSGIALSDGYLIFGISIPNGVFDIRRVSNRFLKMDFSGNEIWTDRYRNVLPTEIKQITSIPGKQNLIGIGDLLIERNLTERSVDDADWALLQMR